MSWLFSRALVEESSPGTCLDGEPLLPLSVMPTPHRFWRKDKTIDCSDLSRFGLTCRVLTADRGAELLTSYLAGFPVRTSASPAAAPASTEHAVDFGATWPGSLAKFDPESCGWKTVQPCDHAGSDESSVTWPRSGMTVAGWCWELPMSKRRTSATAFGSLLPTPTAENYGSCQGGAGGRAGHKNRPSLFTMAKHALWPTPTTPAGNCVGRLDEWGGSRSRAVMRTLVSAEELGGPLNPTWVEWLMGWPLGWTDLEPLATDKSRCAPPQPFASSQLDLLEEATA